MDKKKLILSITGVTLLVLAIVGATFAYFSASATNNTTVVGNTSEASNLELTITKMDSATGGLIPMNDNLAGTGITNNCVDSNGNTVCHVYDIEIKNGKSKVMISGNINFTSYSNSNIVYDIIFSDIADGASSEKDLDDLAEEVGTTTTGTTYSTPGTLTTSTSFDANEIKHYYLVAWLHDTSAAQQDTDGGKENGYTGTVSFNAVDGDGNNSGVTAVFSTNSSASTPVSFATDSWETIQYAVQTGNTSAYNVGDTREIELSGFEKYYTYTIHHDECIATFSDSIEQLLNEDPEEICSSDDEEVANEMFDLCVEYAGMTEEEILATGAITREELGLTIRIANKSTPSECSTSGFSQSACGFVIEFVDFIKPYKMNTSNTNAGGWPASEMYTYVNNTIYNALPNDLRNVIIDTTVVSGHGSSDSSNFTSTDKLYLLSTHEVFEDVDGNTSTGIDYWDSAYSKTRQLDYYANNNVTTSNYSGAIKNYLTGMDFYWWLRNADSYQGFAYVYDDGSIHSGDASNGFGVAPAFRIG